MSSLNLEPNPTIMAVQAGLFALNFVAVKKLFLDPYIRVYDKRQNLTVGSQSQTKDLVSKNESILTKIQSSFKEVNGEAAKIRESITHKASLERKDIVAKAEQEAKEIVSQINKQISQLKKEERPKIPQAVEQISDSIFKQIIEV